MAEAIGWGALGLVLRPLPERICRQHLQHLQHHVIRQGAKGSPDPAPDPEPTPAKRFRAVGLNFALSAEATQRPFAEAQLNNRQHDPINGGRMPCGAPLDGDTRPLFRGSVLGREGEEYRGAVAGDAFELHMATVQTHDPLHDRQAETETPRVG